MGVPKNIRKRKQRSKNVYINQHLAMEGTGDDDLADLEDWIDATDGVDYSSIPFHINIPSYPGDDLFI